MSFDWTTLPKLDSSSWEGRGWSLNNHEMILTGWGLHYFTMASQNSCLWFRIRVLLKACARKTPDRQWESHLQTLDFRFDLLQTELSWEGPCQDNWYSHWYEWMDQQSGQNTKVTPFTVSSAEMSSKWHSLIGITVSFMEKFGSSLNWVNTEWFALYRKGYNCFWWYHMGMHLIVHIDCNSHQFPLYFW